MNDYRLLTKEEQLIYMIKFYRNYLNQIKLILEQLEKELGSEIEFKNNLEKEEGECLCLEVLKQTIRK